MSTTPIFDAVIKATGINPTVPVATPRPMPLTKRQRHKLTPITEAVLVQAGFSTAR